MSLEDWTAVGSIATAALAIGTFLVILQARRERSQIVIDRELTWRPALKAVHLGQIQIEGRPPIGMTLSSDRARTIPILYNAGGGPAIAARVMWSSKTREEATRWFVTAQVDVAAGVGSEIPSAAWIEDDDAAGILASITAGEDLAGAIFCRDFLERRWCFPIPDGDHQAILVPVEWRAGRSTPTWAASETLWRGSPRA